MPSITPQGLRAIVLGNDAVLAARPATPTQVARACLEVGYDFVAPVSWGEELLAMRVVDAARQGGMEPAVVAHCPFVVEALREEAPAATDCWTGVAPPVATARYLRAAFADREVHVTYAGRCPGASAPDVDECVFPEVLLGRLVDAGVVPDQQPDWFDASIPPDRSRYASQPGGVPVASLLATETGAELREAAPVTLGAVSHRGPDGDRRIIDLEVATGCVCARERHQSGTVEPPRAGRPVVRTDLEVELSLVPLPKGPADLPPPETPEWFPVSHESIALGGGWWSDGPAPADSSPTPRGERRFTDTVEPWSSRPSLPLVVPSRPPSAVRVPRRDDPAPSPTESGRFAFSLNTPEEPVAPRTAAYAFLRAPVAPDVEDAFALLAREERRSSRLRLARRAAVLVALVGVTVGGAFVAQWLLASGTLALPHRERPSATALPRATSDDGAPSTPVAPPTDSVKGGTSPISSRGARQSDGGPTHAGLAPN